MEAREIRRLFCSAVAKSTAMIKAPGLVSDDVEEGRGLSWVCQI